jgi:hypothetical protein
MMYGKSDFRPSTQAEAETLWQSLECVLTPGS